MHELLAVLIIAVASSSSSSSVSASASPSSPAATEIPASHCLRGTPDVLRAEAERGGVRSTTGETPPAEAGAAVGRVDPAVTADALLRTVVTAFVQGITRQPREEVALPPVSGEVELEYQVAERAKLPPAALEELPRLLGGAEGRGVNDRGGKGSANNRPLERGG